MQPNVSSYLSMGLAIYPYGVHLMLGTLFGAWIFLSLSKPRGLSDRALIASALMLPLGLIVSRALYCLADTGFHAVASLQNALDITRGGLSMFGALFGMVLAVRIAAGRDSSLWRRLLDCFAPSAMSFILFARLGERYTALGLSRPLVSGEGLPSFLIYRDTYDAYLKTWLLEAAAALVLYLVLSRKLKRAHREGGVFLLGVLLFSLTQVIFESLRYDGHMRSGFVGVQQVLSAILYAGAVAAMALRGRNMPALRRPAWLILVLTGVAVMLCLWLEFLIDRSALNKGLLYALYTLCLAVPACLAAGIDRRSRYHG